MKTDVDLIEAQAQTGVTFHAHYQIIRQDETNKFKQGTQALSPIPFSSRKRWQTQSWDMRNMKSHNVIVKKINTPHSLELDLIMSETAGTKLSRSVKLSK